jgi:hypothetical protein
MRANSKPRSSEEKLDLVYSRRRIDIEDAFEYQFGKTAPEKQVEPPQPQVTVDTGATVTTGVKVTTGEGFKAKIVQDAHTVWEQTLYDALWTAAAGDPNGPKTICAGYRTLAAQTRLGDKTIKRNLRSLEEKLAIEPIAEENSHTNTGRTYRVYSFREILERRRARGLEWVIRNRQAVLLTTFPGATLTPGVSEAPGVKEATGDTMTRAPVVTVATPPVVSMTTHLEKASGNTERTSSATEPASAEIVRALIDATGRCDDKAALDLVKDCRARVADITDEEIGELVRREGKRMRNPKNPTGFMLRQVPLCCEGESFRAFRQSRQRQGREAPLEDPVETERRYRAIVDDPNASEPEKRLALAILGKT